MAGSIPISISSLSGWDWQWLDESDPGALVPWLGMLNHSPDPAVATSGAVRVQRTVGQRLRATRGAFSGSESEVAYAVACGPGQAGLGKAAGIIASSAEAGPGGSDTGDGADDGPLHERAHECDAPGVEVPQVFIHYGSRCSLELAEEYGFCLGTDHGAAPLGVEVPLEWVFSCLGSNHGSADSGGKPTGAMTKWKAVLDGQDTRPPGGGVTLPTRSEAVLLFRALARLHGCDECLCTCDECSSE